MAEVVLSLTPDAESSLPYKAEKERKKQSRREVLLAHMGKERMTGIFSRLSGVRSAHQTTQNTADTHEAPEDVEIGGIDVDIDFRPIEHPIEPINQDQPVRCPLPEPSILNDGRVWKERMSSTGAQARHDLPVMKKGGAHPGKECGERRHKSAPRSRPITPFISAP